MIITENYKSSGLKLFVGLLLSVTFLACQSDDEDVSLQELNESLEFILDQRLSDVVLFQQAVERAGLQSLLTSENTLFVPNDAAFQEALTANGYNSVDEAPVDFLADLINYHSVAGTVLSSDLTTGQVSTNLSGASIGIIAGDAVILNGEATVTDADNTATNGVIHVIDNALGEIPSLNVGALVESSAGAETPEFTLLNAALDKTGLKATLNGAGGFTVFAPTDAAFIAAGIDQAAIDALTVEELTEVLIYHVVDGYTYSPQLEDDSRVTTLAGSDTQGIEISLDGGVILNSNHLFASASVIDANVLASNGVVHVINNVLDPIPYLIDAIDPGNGYPIDEVLELSEDFSFYFKNFFQATEASSFDYQTLLSGDEEFTILVPDSIPGINLSLSDEELTAIIDDHIFEGLVDFSGIESGGKISSINGSEYYITQNGGGSTINGLGIRAEYQDLPVYNGFLTDINALATPLPSDSLTEVLAAVDSLSLFGASLMKLGLAVTDGFTLFAVPDADLQPFLTGIGIENLDSLNALDESIEEDAEILSDLEAEITKYIVSTVVVNEDISEDLPVLTSLAGGTINFVINAGEMNRTQIVNIDDDNENQDNIDILAVDIFANNGVIHVIDRLFLE